MTVHVQAGGDRDQFVAETERFRRELLAHCYRMVDTYLLGAPGDWRMIATTANAQPAASVSRVVEFHDPALVVTFGFPDALAAEATRSATKRLCDSAFFSSPW